MECPYCAHVLRVIDRSPAPAGTFFRLTCPARGCGKELVAHAAADGELALMTRGEVRFHATRIVFHALRADFAFPLAGAVGTAMLTAFLAIWQIVNPAVPADNVNAVLGIIGGGAVIVAVFGASIVVDLALGVRGWRNALPRPLIDVKTMPTDYRT